ncbi:MAG: hypothetical protein K0S37_798 [Microbacterium sp.]|jgi:hypothetical protein|nr:hypothetical protein [Microbacterium sp.]
MSEFWETVGAQLDRIEYERPDTFAAVAQILAPVMDRGAIYGTPPDSEPWLAENGNRYADKPATLIVPTTYAPRRAFFAGSGGDRSLWSALHAAGWRRSWALAPSYHWAAQHPNTGERITYVEGDVYPGDVRA